MILLKWYNGLGIALINLRLLVLFPLWRHLPAIEKPLRLRNHGRLRCRVGGFACEFEQCEGRVTSSLRAALWAASAIAGEQNSFTLTAWELLWSSPAVTMIGTAARITMSSAPNTVKEHHLGRWGRTALPGINAAGESPSSSPA